MNALEKVFNQKLTENGDKAYRSTGDNLLDILFMSAYYEKHLIEVKLGTSDVEKLFARFMRDPRLGLGRRDLGRELMKLSDVSPEEVVKSGRFDDLVFITQRLHLMYLYEEVKAGNELAKKWCPRLNSKNRDYAKALCKVWGVSQKEYRKLIKVDTTERKLTEDRADEINFEHVPSLAMIKYFNRFANGSDTFKRFNKYLDDVENGKAKLNISTTTVYDIYKNRDKIDADLFFDKLEKINLNCIPIVDVSGSMFNDFDAIGKALSIGHYLARCSTFCKDMFVTFSVNPELVKLDVKKSYAEQLRQIKQSHWGFNTDFGAVMELLKNKLDEAPEYLVVLSDMEFDEGSYDYKEELMREWEDKGINTKIVWWNFNARNTTVPETDEYGNIFFSGYNPMLLKFLKVEFDGKRFLKELLDEYEKAINK
jgi:hypothetical protein|nr:MAG TPA: protein of unknown function (DUF2828) [Caudoviricetes sp.]